MAVREKLEAKLRTRGGSSWLQEECDAVAALGPAVRRRSADTFLAIKGAPRAQAPRSSRSCASSVIWREGRAEETDRPAFKILGNESLMKLAEKRPGTTSELRQVPGVLPRLRPHADDLLAAIRRGGELPEEDLPVIPRAPRPVIPPEVVTRAGNMKEWRKKRAAELEIDVSVVLPQRLIDRLAAAGPRDRAGLEEIEGLRRWRIDAFGEELLATIAA